MGTLLPLVAFAETQPLNDLEGPSWEALLISCPMTRSTGCSLRYRLYIQQQIG